MNMRSSRSVTISASQCNRRTKQNFKKPRELHPLSQIRFVNLGRTCNSEEKPRNLAPDLAPRHTTCSAIVTNTHERLCTKFYSLQHSNRTKHESAQHSNSRKSQSSKEKRNQHAFSSLTSRATARTNSSRSRRSSRPPTLSFQCTFPQ